MKKINKILIGIFTFAILFTLFNVNTVLAALDPPIPVNQSGIYPYRIEAHNKTSYQFQNKTQLTIQANVTIEGYIDCDALSIGGKEFETEIVADGDLQMNMTCTREEAQLGLQLGNTYRVRNRNQNLSYQEGFCIQIQTNKSDQEQIQAKLKIKSNKGNQGGTWVYWDPTDQEWVPVQTTEVEGNLVCETNHFSYWTILIPETDDDSISAFLGVELIIGISVIAVVLVVYLKKRK
ncbi:MAG: hypothetical protein HWN81_14370 [Candidatus Lokiarchaeota archaeon]|nr:hypothetical protein [Candidatus Lokiarchaeota archaeon]